MLSLLLGVKSLVTLLNQPFEHPVEHGLRHGADGVEDLVDITTLGDELVTDLDLGLQQGVVEERRVDTQQLGDTFTILQTVF